MHFSAGGQIDSNYDIFIFTKIVKLCIQKYWINKIDTAASSLEDYVQDISVPIKLVKD